MTNVIVIVKLIEMYASLTIDWSSTAKYIYVKGIA
jgi:hypothetical protein